MLPDDYLLRVMEGDAPVSEELRHDAQHQRSLLKDFISSLDVESRSDTTVLAQLLAAEASSEPHFRHRYETSQNSVDGSVVFRRAAWAWSWSRLMAASYPAVRITDLKAVVSVLRYKLLTTSIPDSDNLTLTVFFALLPSESTEDIRWCIELQREWFPGFFGSGVDVTDRGAALLANYPQPECHHWFCYWHLKNDLSAHLGHFATAEVSTRALDLFQKVRILEYLDVLLLFHVGSRSFSIFSRRGIVEIFLLYV